MKLIDAIQFIMTLAKLSNRTLTRLVNANVRMEMHMIVNDSLDNWLVNE